MQGSVSLIAVLFRLPSRKAATGREVLTKGPCLKVSFPAPIQPRPGRVRRRGWEPRASTGTQGWGTNAGTSRPALGASPPRHPFLSSARGPPPIPESAGRRQEVGADPSASPGAARSPLLRPPPSPLGAPASSPSPLRGPGPARPSPLPRPRASLPDSAAGG